MTFLIKTRRLEPGYYAALDIGGGSSDLSFFRVTDDNRIKYLASEAFILGANDVYRFYLKTEQTTHTQIKNAEREVRGLEISQRWKDNRRYLDAVENILEHLHNRLYYLFNYRVYWYFGRNKGLLAYKNQPCFVYGGGARFPRFEKLDYIVIHDNGQRGLPEHYTYLRKVDIDSYIPDLNILPSDDTWRSDFGLLVVAFGLSFPHHHDETYWDMNEYTFAHHPPEELRQIVPHPFNEDMYLYDILAEKWKS